MKYTCVVATGKIVGSILLATNKLLRVEELAVSTSPHLINHCWFKINKDGTRDMLPSTSLTEKSVEGIITSTNSLVTGHLAIRLQNGLYKLERYWEVDNNNVLHYCKHIKPRNLLYILVSVIICSHFHFFTYKLCWQI